MSKPLAIFGAGLSAQAALRLAQSQGRDAVLFDEGGSGSSVEFTREDLSLFDDFVFSPGFAEDHPWRQLVESSNVVCTSELAYAAKYWKGKIIGITGTNGKSTLTALLQKALKFSGKESIAAGNIGCMMQIGSAATTPIVHTAELVDWATGGPKPRKLQDR